MVPFMHRFLLIISVNNVSFAYVDFPRETYSLDKFMKKTVLIMKTSDLGTYAANICKFGTYAARRIDSFVTVILLQLTVNMQCISIKTLCHEDPRNTKLLSFSFGTAISEKDDANVSFEMSTIFGFEGDSLFVSRSTIDVFDCCKMQIICITKNQIVYNGKHF